MAALGACGGEKPVIRVHAWETDSHFINNAIFSYIVEKGYGYSVEEVIETTPVLKEALPDGEVDLNLEGWQHNIPEWYQENLDGGNIVNLGMYFEGGPQFYMIPKWVAEEYGIRSVHDLEEYWELFTDPQDPSKGLFYNGILGWQATEINRVKLEAYGLTRFYNLEAPGSVLALEAALETAQQGHQPVLGYYWSPAPLNAAYEWQILEEPPYTPACWEAITLAAEDSGLRPANDVCGFPNPPIDKLAHKGLLKKAPDVVEMLRKMQVGLEPLNQVLAWARQNKVVDFEEAASYYLRNNEDRWRGWVTPEAYQNVKAALGPEG